ncbi:MAG: aminotransferase class IV [Thermovirgaceae bacterium]|nr:aminotransferase class IV [Thermovirgaceae bacterium]
MTICYAEGDFTELERASLPLSDLAFQRGIGVFETIRIYDGHPMAMTPHLERLAESARRCRIALPLPLEEMKDLIREGVRRYGENGRARPFITGGDVLDKEKGFTKPRFYVFFEPLDAPSEKTYLEGVALHPVDASRPMPSIKSINYLGSYLPLAEDPGALEILYCPGGEITESSHSNAFMIKDGKILTAPVERVLEGTMRNMAIEIAREAGFIVEVRCPRDEELPLCSEFFITGSVKEILPVSRVGKTFIGGGKPGPVSAHLRRLYLQNIERWVE